MNLITKFWENKIIRHWNFSNFKERVFIRYFLILAEGVFQNTPFCHGWLCFLCPSYQNLYPWASPAITSQMRVACNSYTK